MKIVSFLLLVTSAACMGMRFTKNMNTRVRSLKTFEIMLHSMLSFIEFTADSVQSIMSGFLLNESLSGFIFIKKFNELDIDDFSERWTEALLLCSKELCLSNADVELLRSLGTVIGTTDINGQRQSFSVHIRMLEENISEAAEKVKRYSNVVMVTSIVAAITVFLLLA